MKQKETETESYRRLQSGLHVINKVYFLRPLHYKHVLLVSDPGFRMKLEPFFHGVSILTPALALGIIALLRGRGSIVLLTGYLLFGA